MPKNNIQINLDIGADLGKVEQKTQKLKTILDGITIPGISSKNFQGEIQQIQQRIKSLQDLTGEPIELKTDITKASKDFSKVSNELGKLQQEINQLKRASSGSKLRLLPENQQKQIKDAEKAVNSYNNSISQEIQKTKELINAEKKLQKLREENASAQSKTVISNPEKKAQTSKLKELTERQSQADQALYDEQQRFQKKGWVWGDTGRNFKKDETQKIIKEYEEATKALQEFQEKASKTITQPELDKITKDLQEQEDKVNVLTDSWEKLKATTAQTNFENLRQSAEKLGVNVDDIGAKVNSVDVEKLQSRLLELKQKGLDEVDSALTELQQGFSGIAPSLSQVGNKIRDSQNDWEDQAQAMEKASRQAKELANLKNQVLDFFSISETIQLFKRSVESAFETVKELDSAMTEIAVVSDFSVNDMWSKLPEFTKQANELGMAIKDTYEATTLYVQQGLDLNNSMKLATETLKMAAVAGMDASNATDALTSALRGFNMELNETSAQKINDVYSELAAITASDVQELSTAMSKTASIAHSVNMEFETTAAFLAQGIETTREAAETI